MKLTKKKVFVAALAVCLVAILSMGTLAWFNDADEVKNQFLFSDSDQDGTPDFSVDVYETDPETGDKVDGLVYTDLYPSQKLHKDPHIINEGDYDQWIRVYVTFDEWTALKAACGNKGLSGNLLEWLTLSVEFNYDGEIINKQEDTITYVFYLDRKLTPNEEVVLFRDITIPAEFDQYDLTFADADFTINVKAEALQADNTGDNAKDAFAKYWGK